MRLQTEDGGPSQIFLRILASNLENCPNMVHFQFYKEANITVGEGIFHRQSLEIIRKVPRQLIGIHGLASLEIEADRYRFGFKNASNEALTFYGDRETVEQAIDALSK